MLCSCYSSTYTRQRLPNIAKMLMKKSLLEKSELPLHLRHVHKSEPINGQAIYGLNWSTLSCWRAAWQLLFTSYVFVFIFNILFCTCIEGDVPVLYASLLKCCLRLTIWKFVVCLLGIERAEWTALAKQECNWRGSCSSCCKNYNSR